jgi:predicted Abi (CAAX) family protease
MVDISPMSDRSRRQRERAHSLSARFRSAYATCPSASDWRFAAGQAAWLLPLLGLLGWLGGFASWKPALGSDSMKLLAIAFFLPVLAEESLFRVALIPPDRGAAKTGRAAIVSVLLFTFWHPLQNRLYWVPWADLADNPWFLAAVAALGAACARLWLRTGSIWPCVALHWIVVALWKTAFGARLALPHL